MRIKLIILCSVFLIQFTTTSIVPPPPPAEDLPISSVISPYDFHPENNENQTGYYPGKDKLEPKNMTQILPNSSESFDMRNFNIAPKKEEDVIIYSFDPLTESKYPKSDVELIENGQNTEDEFMMTNLNFTNKIYSNYKLINGTDKFIVVLGVATLFVFLTVFFALLYWRQVIKTRYGSRQILINEEDFAKDAMKHFSL